jgi:hypothetical protein
MFVLTGSESSYYGEPLPLKKPYPRPGIGAVEAILKILGFFLVLVALSLPGGSKAPFPGPWWLLLGIMVLLIGVAFFLFWFSGLLDGWIKAWQWQRAFKENNSDLHIDWKAYEKAITHMRQTTRYSCTGFRDGAVQLTLALRLEGTEEAQYSQFGAEILQNYRHFKDGIGSLACSALPKQAN